MKTSNLIYRYLLIGRKEWRAFTVYGLGFALLTLLVPLIVQLLVTNLMFSGLGLSLFTLSIMLGLGLMALQLCRFSQVLLLEYIERQFIERLTFRFEQKDAGKQIKFFEIAMMIKTISKWALDGFETFLALIVGTVVLMIYHPYFVVLSVLVWGGIYVVWKLGSTGLETAIEESNQKYLAWNELSQGRKEEGSKWLTARALHFKILKRQLIVLIVLQVVGSLALLMGGALLFQANQLSIGQFVAAELIGTGLFLAIGKLSKFLELHYSLITSLVKIDSAIGVGNE
ncbi:MAG: hypothetical protein ACLGG0_13270 [Bacteriovoracia bacterium]